MSFSEPKAGTTGSVSPVATGSGPELQARLDELEAIYRATPVAICVVDRNLRITRANNEYAEIVDRPIDDIIGRTLEEVVHPLVRNVAIGLFTNVIETGRAARNLEVAGISRTHPREELVWLFNCHPVKIAGKVTAAIGVLQNVTAMKQLEQTASARLRELETIYRNMPVGLALIDTSLRYVRVNEVLADMNGLSVDEHLGRHVFEVLPELDPNYATYLRGMMNGERLPQSYEIQISLPGDPGVEHTLMVRYEIVRSEEGEISGLVASILDVTDRARAEQEALAAQARAEEQLGELEALYAVTPAGLCTIDRDLQVLRLNDSLVRGFGVPREDCIGRSLYQLAPELIGQIAEPLRLAFELSRPGVNLEINGPSPGDPGRICTWLVNLHPLRSRSGTVRALVVLFLNISTLKQQVAEIATVNARLEEAQRMTRIGNFEWNLADDEMWWSDELYTLVGRARDDFEPTWERLFEMVHPDDRMAVRRQLEEILADEAPRSTEFRIVLTDLSERVLRGAWRLERSADGFVKRLFGTCQEVVGLDTLTRE